MPTIVTRFQCKTCSRYVVPEELTLGVCQHCLALHLDNPEVANLPAGIEYARCADCNTVLMADAYQHWDRHANRFLIVCIACSDRRVAQDPQYRGTQYGWEHKNQ